MGKIVLLDKETSSQIAAGEVVTGPAAIVKELVENALDAGAHRIVIETADGGKTSVRVIDDGEGIAFEDVPMAFHRYATSKIKQPSDLTRLSTFGFRGEALPSIAAVARLQMTTRRPGDVAGTKIVLEGGEQKDIGETGCPAGTNIEITDLFYNTPARRKFLQSNLAEGAKVADVVTRLALGNPAVSFTLTQNGRKALYTAGKDLLTAIASLYGQEMARLMISLHAENGPINVSGFIADPTRLTRASRQYQTFFLNSRYVKSNTLAQALEKALQERLMVGRRPIAVINIGLPSEMADINIHPAKLAVRLFPEKEIIALLSEAVQKATANLFPGRLLQSPPASQEPAPKGENIAIFESNRPYSEAGPAIAGSDGIDQPVSNHAATQAAATAEAVKSENCITEGAMFFPALTVMGQVENTYIVAKEEGKLYLIDQHAAHERVLYEGLAEKKGLPHKQTLLVPETLEMAPADVSLVVENIFSFQDLGFDLEHFGGNTFLLRSAPVDVNGASGARIFVEIITALQEGGTGREIPWRERLVVMTACKAAIKAGDRLNQQQMEELLKSLASCRNPYNCPHGRPTIIHISGGELEKKFKRVL